MKNTRLKILNPLDIFPLFQYDIFYTPAVTNKLIPLPAATKISVTDGHPVATMGNIFYFKNT